MLINSNKKIEKRIYEKLTSKNINIKTFKCTEKTFNKIKKIILKEKNTNRHILITIEKEEKEIIKKIEKYLDIYLYIFDGKNIKEAIEINKKIYLIPEKEVLAIEKSLIKKLSKNIVYFNWIKLYKEINE